MPRRTQYRPPTRFSVMPPVIKNLLVLNGLFFIAQFLAAETVASSSLLAGVLDLMPLYPSDLWPWQLVSYSFIHADFGHLFFNMFALWMFGVQIENRWGSQRFLSFYFVCVIGAALTHMTFVSSQSPMVGASGGVYGILLAFGMMFPNQPIYIWFLFPIKAKWLVTGFGALEVYWAVFPQGGATNIAHFAHLGGMIFGFLLIQYWRGKLPVKPERAMRW